MKKITRWPRATCSSCRPGSPGRSTADEQFDLFRFSDAPVVERLHFDRVQIEDEPMKLATVRTPGGTAAARVEGQHGVLIDGVADVGALLAATDWRSLAEQATGTRVPTG